jgi:16S rRNA (guanine527-N7)-methyltransferase
MAGSLVRPQAGWPLEKALEPASTALATAGEARHKLATWLDALAQWNARVDLTAARSAGELVDLMIADAAQIANAMPRDARVIDVGTGAGAPGLALAILRPDLKMTLVEPLAKRTSFLRTVLAAIGRRDVTVEGTRIDTLSKNAWDVAMARATFPPPQWLEIGLDLAPAVWVFLAKEPAPESARARVTTTLDYEWPNTAARRTSILYGRT